MEKQQSILNILVIWRGKKLNVEMNSGATLKEFGHKLQKLTNVKPDTMRLLVPQSSEKSSKLITPFSDKHSSLSLEETSILEAKSIRMMGVFQDEINEISQNSKVDLRIAGFDEEEKRMRQRMLNSSRPSLKLPQGAYIFCDFRTLHIPGLELNPPASEALRRMHMLAADPGIVAIMNKHRWRVGIMTEMAPEGYVGISPKCILGFNKNQGEEISLRLRTDDLKGFRKYESIKKTLLHELAHMVHSEHDANFHALDKQLNQEADSLDWTRSKGHTLSGLGHSDQYEEFYVGTSSNINISQKLGGNTSDHNANARASSVAAAYRRLANATTDSLGISEVRVEPDPDDSENEVRDEPDPDEDQNILEPLWNPKYEPDPHYYSGVQNKFEPDPDDSLGGDAMEFEPDPDDSLAIGTIDHGIKPEKIHDEPDPDDSEVKSVILEYESSASRTIKIVEDETRLRRVSEEPDPDDSELKREILDSGNTYEPDPDDSQTNGGMDMGAIFNGGEKDPKEDSRMEADEPDPDDQELQRIQDPVRVACMRLQKAIEMLQSEVNPTEAMSVLQTLFKIIRNVIEHPDEIKFRRLRKANPMFQRNVANYKAAVEFLFVVGFNEEVMSNETYVVLKRNDPGLLWLAKSSLETCLAC